MRHCLLGKQRYDNPMVWSVIEPGKKKGYSLCRCHCGTVKEVRRAHMNSGASTSCGCVTRRTIGARMKSHGMSKTRLYRIWANMRNRCLNPNVPCYSRYGGRGIEVCSEWKRFEPFRAWAEANGYASDLELDRIDNDGNYSPENCRWVSHIEQSLNRRATVRLSDGGAGVTVAEENGINGDAFRARVRLGWSVEEACTRPLRPFLDRRKVVA